MAVGAVFATTINSSIQQTGGLSKDLQTLQKSLAEGKVSAAQAAFTQYKKDLPSVGVKKTGVEESTRNSADNTLKTDLQGLQNALSAGDISGAQDAFLKLKQDLRKTEPDKTSSRTASTPKESPENGSSGGTGVQVHGAKLDIYA